LTNKHGRAFRGRPTGLNERLLLAATAKPTKKKQWPLATKKNQKINQNTTTDNPKWIFTSDFLPSASCRAKIVTPSSVQSILAANTPET
jgi:hypothetical protein